MWDKVDRGEFDGYKHDAGKRFDETLARLASLEKALAERTPELLEEMREALATARDNEAAIKTKAEEAEGIVKLLAAERDSTTNALKPLKAELAETNSLNATLKAGVAESQQLRADLIASKAKSDATVSEITGNLEKSKVLLKQAGAVPPQVEAAGKLLAQCEGLRDNIQGMVNHSLERKAQIDEVHNEIYGQEIKGTSGSVERIEGLREKIKKSLERTDADLAELKARAEGDVKSVTDKLNALMPRGMAAGLSAAYEDKANTEITTQKRLEKNFVWAIAGLATISLIPFAVDVYLLSKGMALIDVIRETPVVPIIPLYFPVLWFAYSTNKKVNLSKRLIEEYTHKSVLGKTFSGLSNQIDSLPKEAEVTKDLRIRLLYNVLQVSAENPGKLITDYSKSDHPVMEALENSSRLSGSIDALQRMPGFNQLAQWLTAKQTQITVQQAEKVAEGLEAVTVLTPKK